MKTAAYYLAHLNDQSIDWEEIPAARREEVLDLAAKESRQGEGLGGGWNQHL